MMPECTLTRLVTDLPLSDDMGQHSRGRRTHHFVAGYPT